MVTIAGSLLGEMAPEPGPTSTEQALELSRQMQIVEALNNLQQEAVAVNNALAAAQQNVPPNEIARMEAQIQEEPGKFSQPAMEIAALQSRLDEIANLTLQLEDELSVPGARGGLGRYDATRGPQYSPPQQYENISFLGAPTAPQTQAQQQAIQQSFNTMDEGIRSAPTPMTQEQQEIAAMMEVEATIAEAQAQVAANNLSAMSMMANQAAAEAFSNAIAAGATVAEATAAAENAAQTAAQQAAAQIGINPNSPTVTSAAMNAVNTQAVEMGRLAGMTPAQVAAVAQQAVTQAQKGNIAPNTLNQLGLLSPLGLAITAPEVEARRAMEAQQIMEQAMLSPAPVSPPTPEQNPRGTGRGVSLPTQNPSPAFQNRAMTTSLFGPKESNVLNFPAPPPVPINNMLNQAFAIEGFTPNQATPAYSNEEAPPTPPANFNFTGVPATVPGTTFGKTTPGLEPNIGLTSPQAFGVTGYSPGFNNLDDIGFMDQNAQSFDYTAPNMAPSRSFAAPQISFTPDALSFGNPNAQNAINEAMQEFGLSDPAAPPDPSGVQSSVPGISISPTGMLGAIAGYDDTMNSTAGSFSGTPDPPSQNPRSVSPGPPSPNPSRGKSAITSMMDLENTIAQQQAQQELNAINSMMDLEAAVGQQQAKAERANTLSSLNLAEATPAPTTSRSSSSRGRSSGRSSSGRSSRGAAQSTKTRTVATWGPDNQVTFSQEAADPSDTGPGCYIATDAVSAGAFSKLDKAKAELWCKRALHNHWAGETVRLGYQALSKRAVANGTASKHYDEFQRFVRYGRGLDKTFKGAVTFYTRMAQFFAVGVINRLKAR